MVIAVDFDGTLFEDKFPDIGEPIVEVIELIKRYIADGHVVILWTCRVEDRLREAVAKCEEYGIQFSHVNENSCDNLARYGTDCRKIAADIYLDDKAFNPDTLRKMPRMSISDVEKYMREIGGYES